MGGADTGVREARVVDSMSDRLVSIFGHFQREWCPRVCDGFAADCIFSSEGIGSAESMVRGK